MRARGARRLARWRKRWPSIRRKSNCRRRSTRSGLALVNQAVAANQQQEEAIVLRFANALWSRPGEPITQTFSDTLGRYYGARVREAHFTHPEVARQGINEWAAGETGGRIANLIPSGVLSPATTLVLTNAISFRGRWEKAFQETDTHPAPFTLPDGTRG